MHPQLEREETFVPGRMFAQKYQVTRLIPARPPGIACLARDALTNRDVELRAVPVRAAASRALLERYRRDLFALRGTTHPGIAVCDAGEAGGVIYAAVAARGGRTVRDVLREERLRPSDIVALLMRAASALAAVHACKVLHADLRPEQLVVWPPGEIGILPFGIERDVRQMTMRHPIDSEWAYAAPEFILGLDLTPAADVYSLGAIAYEALTGAPPRAGFPLTGRCTSPAPPIAAASGADAALARIVERCLEADPAARFQTPGELEAACRAVQQQAEGRRLAGYLSDDPLDPEIAVPLLRDICAKLKAVHQSGKAHREPSPSSIAIRDDGGVDISSFDPPPNSATIPVLDPKYAAPETLLARTPLEGAGHVLADVYVIGFVFYELLAGRRAFQSQFGDAGGPESTLHWMNWHADRSARLRKLAEMVPDTPKALADVIDRMIEKDPAQRVQSLEDVEQRLQQLETRLQDTQPFAIPAFAQRSGGRKGSRFWLAATAVVLLFMAAGAALIVLRPELFGIESAGAAVRDAASALLRRQTGAAAIAGSQSSAPPSVIMTRAGAMVLVPGGAFTMGSTAADNERPERGIALPPYYIDRCEVTNGAYRDFCERTRRPMPRPPSWDPAYFSRPAHPVLNVSWSDASAFCAAAGKRLPAEAEWEKAARGAIGSGSWANWSVAGLANLKGTGAGAPAAVASYPADVSPFGALDMAGNVHEWTADDYALYPGNSAVLPPEGVRKVVRGGSYALPPGDASPHWRASLRPDLDSGVDSPVGFRCAAGLSEAAAIALR